MSFIAEMHKISLKKIVYKENFVNIGIFVLSSHQAFNRTTKYKQLVVKSPMGLNCTYIFEKLMHTAPKKLHLPFQRQQTSQLGYLILIYCTVMLQFYQFQAEYAFTQPSYSALKQIDWKLRQPGLKWCAWRLENSSNIFFSLCWFAFEWFSVFFLYRPHPDFKCSAASFNSPSEIFFLLFLHSWTTKLTFIEKKLCLFLFRDYSFRCFFLSFRSYRWKSCFRTIADFPNVMHTKILLFRGWD